PAGTFYVSARSGLGLFRSRVRDGSGCAQLESAGIAAAKPMHASPTLPSIAFPNRAAGVSAKLQFGDNGWETSMGNGTAIEQTNLSSRHLLAALRAFRKGNFSVRLPMDLTGLDGEIADAFNDVVELNERMSKEIERLSHIVGKQGKIGHRAKLPNATGLWAANIDMVNDLIGDMVQPTGENGARDRCGGQGRPVADDESRDRGPCVARRIFAHRQSREHDVGAARLVRLGSDARGPRGRHRGPTRRSGQGGRRGGDPEATFPQQERPTR